MFPEIDGFLKISLILPDKKAQNELDCSSSSALRLSAWLFQQCHMKLLYVEMVRQVVESEGANENAE